MDGPRDYHTEWNVRQILYDIAYMWHLKKMVQMNLFTKQKESQIEKTNDDYQRGKQERDKLGDWD